MNDPGDSRPTVGDQKIPGWLKLLWVAGIVWIVAYVVLGLRHSPENW